MGAETAWDVDSDTVTITSGTAEPTLFTNEDMGDWWRPEGTEQYQYELKHGAQAELRPDLTILLDGVEQHFVNALGEPVYPIVLRDCVYVPVRSIAPLCGMEIGYIAYTDIFGNHWGEIQLYVKPTPEQVAEFYAYYDQATGYLAEYDRLCADLAAATDLTTETYAAAMLEIRQVMENLGNLPLPSAKVFFWDARIVSLDTKDFIYLGIDYQDPSRAANPDGVFHSWQEARDSFLYIQGHHSYLQMVRSCLSRMKEMADNWLGE
jgi:hypothetical protein